MQQFRLTVTRHNEEPRVKHYTYAKAAQDGFTTAVQRKGRLAESIVLEEILDDTADGSPNVKELRRWQRAAEGPTQFILVGDQNDEAVSYIAEVLCPTCTDVRLVGFPLVRGVEVGALADDPEADTHVEVHYNEDVRVAKLVKESHILDSTHANHLLWLPDYGSGVFARLLVLYHKRYGRFPWIVEEVWSDDGRSLKVVDLNKVNA